jgi:Fe-S cluster biosynthesis and repair protein YggX
MLKLVRDNHFFKQYPTLDDDYIEKMANFYTSEFAKIIFPNIHKTPFSEWLFKQYMLKFEKIS